jgi:hypothetical protein
MVKDEARDPFLEKFFSRIHPSVAQSFTPAQIAAIKLAFGARTWGSHKIDIRLSFPLLLWRYYFVLLAGREQRPPERRKQEGGRHPFASLGNAVITVIFCLVVGIPILLSLYLLQAALSMGNGGTGSFLAQLMEQLGQLFK